MNNLNKKLISAFFITLIIGLSFNSVIVLAQATVVVTPEGRIYDADNDGVCNWKRGDSNYAGNEQIAGRYCTITEYGDLCPGTEGRAGRFGREDSGCSAEQLDRIRDYWSVSSGELKPKFLKVNWLTDSRKGVRAYQEIKLSDNFRTAGEDVEIRDISISCSNDKGIVYQNADIVREEAGNFVNARIIPVAPENRGQKSRIIELQVHRLGEGSGRGEIRTEDINQEKPSGIDEIRTTCTIRTYSCINRADESGNTNCVDLYPPESDEIELRIPIDTVVIRPEEFLNRGIELSQNILDLTNTLIPKVNKFYQFTLKWCGISIAAVIATKFFGFLQGFADLAELIWYGPEELRNYSFTLPSLTGKIDEQGVAQRKEVNSFIISGRSMCAAAVCPKDWCRLGNIQTGTTKDEKGKEIPTTVLSGQKSIQDSLLLSIGCGCVSGILVKLYQLRAIADSWNSCLKQAQAGEEFKGTCDKILSQGICTFVLDELTALKGVNLMSLSYEKIINPLEKEIADAFGLQRAADQSKDRVRDFAETEVKALGEAYGLGVTGYAELPIGRSICYLALYGRLPTVDVYSRFDIDKPIVKTSANINWDSAQVYLGPDNQPLFEYSVEWMVVSGRDNLRYSIYMRGADGAKSERIDTGTGRLARIGDYDSNYLQFVDPAQYVEACVEIPDEFLGPKCFGPGTGSSFGITGDFFGFSDENDKDKDGLPDEWETRHGLKADNQDSDGDGITDNKEDNDKDGINNYNEYKAGTDPNKAGVKEDGSYVESECVATFKNEITTDKAVYNPGETIKLNNIGIDIKGSPADIALKVEITDIKTDFRKNVYFGIDKIAGRNNIDVWTIPTVGADAPANGLYDVRLSLIKWKSSFSNVQCTNSDGRITNSVKDLQIYIGSVGTCINPDTGANEIYTRATCIPKGATGTGLIGYTDECRNGELIEYVCTSAGGCEQSPVLKCLEGQTCENGRCVAKGIYERGICFERDSDNYYADKCDPADETKITKYSFQEINGKCSEQKTSCGANEICVTKSVRFEEANSFGRKSLIGTVVDVGVCEKVEIAIAELTREQQTHFKATNERLNSRPTSFDAITILDHVKDVVEGELKTKTGVTYNDILALMLGIITVESGGSINAVSPGGKGDGYGLMQISAPVQEDVGKGNTAFTDPSTRRLNRDDWKDNVFIGVKYYRWLLQRTGGDVELALAAYNWGIGNVERNCMSGGRLVQFSKCKNVPYETRNYVPLVLKYENIWRKEFPSA